MLKIARTEADFFRKVGDAHEHLCSTHAAWHNNQTFVNMVASYIDNLKLIKLYKKDHFCGTRGVRNTIHHQSRSWCYEKKLRMSWELRKV